MPYNLAALATRNRDFRIIAPTATQSGELLRIYMPIVQRWRDSAAIMLALYAANASNDEIKEQEDTTARDIAILLLLLEFRAFFTKVETWHRAKWLSSVSYATGVDATWMTARPDPAPVMNRAARRAAGVRSSRRIVAPTITEALDNAVSSAASLAKSLSDDAQNRIAQAINAGKRTGSSTAVVTKDVNEGLSKVKRRAAGIAENEVDNAVKAMTDARMDEAGITVAAWRHYTPRERARLWHLARDGNRYAVDDPIWRELYLPNCRCQRRPILSVKR